MESILYSTCSYPMPSLVPKMLDLTHLAFSYSWVATWPNAVLKVKGYRGWKKKKPTHVHCHYTRTGGNHCEIVTWLPLPLAGAFDISYLGCRGDIQVWAVTAWLRAGEGISREVRCDSYKRRFPGLPPLSWLLSSFYLWGGSFNKRAPQGRILLNQIRIKNASNKILCPVLSSYSREFKNMKIFCSWLRSTSGCWSCTWSPVQTSIV